MKIFIKIIIFFYIIFVFNVSNIWANEKIKIGLLVPITGKDSQIGKSIIKSTRLAINKIGNPLIEIIPKDTKSNPEMTLKKAKELSDEEVKIVIGPVFNKNLVYLDELKNMIFLSLTNKIVNNPNNIISAGINSTSQFNTISKFQKMNELKKTIILIPKESYMEEIEEGIKQSKMMSQKVYYYDVEPTKLTKQIEKITKYRIRKNNLKYEIKRIEESNVSNKEKKIENLKKKDTLGRLNFDSVIISDFDESLKSIITSLLYTDVSPKNVYFLTLNQWFDETLLKEENLQPIFFPSINKENYDLFLENYYKKFNEYPNQLSFLSYDLVGLVYYLIVQNNFTIDKKMFLKESMFKGKIGIFEVKDNKINHILNLYKIENNEFKKIF
mgnify:FL=1|tara:strand:+ start:1196 stop:2347 length:1152 start_codon:yes stop_codon:yes gene_type:complete